MLRQFSGVNNRPRGLKPKDALHISLILAVTTWILYHLTYTYESNSIVDSYAQVKIHQEYKIEQESSLDFSTDPATATPDTRNAVQFEKEGREIADTMHQDTGNSEDVLNENDVEKGVKGENRIKEHEAREKSFKDDDASSAVFHDNQMLEIKEEFASGIRSYSENQNKTIDVNKFDFNLSNGTIKETDLQKNTSHLGSLSDKQEGIEDIRENETVFVGQFE